MRRNEHELWRLAHREDSPVVRYAGHVCERRKQSCRRALGDWRDDGLAFTVEVDQRLPVGRSRYNCTARAQDADVWYWFSQPWIRLENDQRNGN